VDLFLTQFYWFVTTWNFTSNYLISTQKTASLDFLVPLVRDMTRDIPAERPSASEALEIFETARKHLTPRDLGSRLKPRQEDAYTGILLDSMDTTREVLHAGRQLFEPLLGRAAQSTPAADTYATQLANQHHGYPLWDPDPHYEPAVEIADVGYVRNGAWVRLFNTSRAFGDRSNKFGVPDGHHPLQIGEIEERTPLPAYIPIQSESVFQLEGQTAFSDGCVLHSDMLLCTYGHVSIAQSLRAIRWRFQLRVLCRARCCAHPRR
jgi:hypothetical protein